MPDLSNALDISRKTARVPPDGNSSRAVCMQYVIHKNWLTGESSGRNPDWLGVSRSCFTKWSYISSNISFSNNLPQIGSIDIGGNSF